MTAARKFDFQDNVKVNLETTTRCGGSCGGCILDATERTGGSLWPSDRFAKLQPFIEGFIEGHLEVFDPLEVSINCGQGDHLLAPPADLGTLVRWIKAAGLGRAIGFLTASAVGRRDRVFRAVDAIRETSLATDQPMWLDLVFDPVKTTLGNFRDTYAANINYIRQSFGGVDFNINVGPDTVASVRPRDLHEFLQASGIVRFTMNLTPTVKTATGFAIDWERLMDWSVEVMALWDPAGSYEINVGQVASMALLGSKGLEEIGSRELAALVDISAQRSIYIDHEDWLWHTQAGFGDAAFSRRVGWSPSVRLPAPRDEAFGKAQESARRFTTKVMGMFHTHPACNGCEYAYVCPRIGSAALRSAMERPLVLSRSANICPAGIKPMLDKFADFDRRGTIRAMVTYDTFSRIPVGFSESVRPNGKVVEKRQVPPVHFDSLGLGGKQ